jgi:hypothetical protein
MVITEAVKQVIAGTPLSLITVNGDGSPHPIVAGSGKPAGETIVFGIYKMEQTQKNLAANKNAWIVGGFMSGGKPQGVRLTGTAEVKGKELIFTPVKAEALI